MRGRPLWELLLFGLVWGVLLIPLRAITRPATERAPRAVAAQQERVTAWVQLRFSEVPERFVLYSQEQPVWQEEHPVPDQEEPLELAWDEPGQGHLRLAVEWASAGRRATEVRVTLPVGSDRGVLIWSRAAAISEALYLR